MASLRSFLLDLRDRGAQPSKRTAMSEIEKTGLAGLVSVGANITALVTAVLTVPFVALVLLGVNVLMIAGCVLLITRKKSVKSRRTCSATTSQAVSLEYRSNQVTRWGAKVALPFLILFTTLVAMQFLPNGLAGRTIVQGSLCTGGRESPLAGAAIDLLDSSGGQVAIQTIETDDYGYFVVDLKRWGRAPAQIVASTPQCGTLKLKVDEAVRTRSFCSSLPEDAVSLGSQGSVWVVSCAAPQEAR